MCPLMSVFERIVAFFVVLQQYVKKLIDYHLCWFLSVILRLLRHIYGSSL